MLYDSSVALDAIFNKFSIQNQTQKHSNRQRLSSRLDRNASFPQCPSIVSSVRSLWARQQLCLAPRGTFVGGEIDTNHASASARPSVAAQHHLAGRRIELRRRNRTNHGKLLNGRHRVPVDIVPVNVRRKTLQKKRRKKKKKQIFLNPAPTSVVSLLPMTRRLVWFEGNLAKPLDKQTNQTKKNKRQKKVTFTFRAPTTPGTTARRGKPWSRGIGSPFILYASKTSRSAEKASSAGIEAP